MWTYRAKIVRVVDGDTLDLRIDLGFRVEMDVRVRLSGVNTPERGHPDWLRACGVTRDWCAVASSAWPLLVTTAKTEKYGRWLAVVTDVSGRSLNDQLVKSGWGLPNA